MARKEHKKRKVVEGSVGVGVEKGLCMALCSYERLLGRGMNEQSGV